MTSNTPIWNFINNYAKSGISRFHMPAHKGVKRHGLEPIDITEINGADYLYESDTIIKKSEQITSEIFGTQTTMFSTEGSSLSIKTMLGIIVSCKKDKSKRVKIIAPRNVHRAFINGCILLDIDPVWVYPSTPSISVCACEVTPQDILQTLQNNPDADAVYITSPDYLGNMADISGISKICKEKSVPLLVDNAHGSYLKFIDKSAHPIDLGADMCCDSAHKTLPVYTGGGYLHIAKSAPEEFSNCAKSVMSMFASTSPSYIIMSSLDLCGQLLQTDFPKMVQDCCQRVDLCKNRINSHGWKICDGEPMKITVHPNSCGLTGDELAKIMREHKIECEYSDYSSIVFMPSPFNQEHDFTKLEKAFAKTVQKKILLLQDDFEIPKTESVMSPRKAAFSQSAEIKTEQAVGKICAKTALSCQPSIPLIVGGEIFTPEIINILKKYSILTVNVIQ